MLRNMLFRIFLGSSEMLGRIGCAPEMSEEGNVVLLSLLFLKFPCLAVLRPLTR